MIEATGPLHCSYCGCKDLEAIILVDKELIQDDGTINLTNLTPVGAELICHDCGSLYTTLEQDEIEVFTDMPRTGRWVQLIHFLQNTESNTT